MSCVAFFFTTSTDSNLVPFSPALIFGNRKKSHRARSGEYGGCFNTRIFLPSKQHPFVCWRIVLVKNPWAVFSHFPSSYTYTFTKGCQNLLIMYLVNSSIFRYLFDVNNSSDIEKNNHQCFEFGIAHRAFFRLAELGLFQCMDWRLVPGSFWKKPWFVTSYYIFWKLWIIFDILQDMSTQLFHRVSFCSGVNSFGTILAQIFVICKFSLSLSLSLPLNYNFCCITYYFMICVNIVSSDIASVYRNI